MADVFEEGVVIAVLQSLNDPMIRIDLEDRLDLGHILLPHRLEELLHLHGRIVGIGHDTGGRFGKPYRSHYIFHVVTEGALDALEHRLDVLFLFLVALVFEILPGVTSIDAFDFHLLVRPHHWDDDFIDLIIHDEDLEVLLSIGLEER